jgi:hypothetical protein
MRQVSNFFYNEVESTLYHYTGVKSLLGIAGSKSLWASNIYFLNDAKEIVQACEILTQLLSDEVIRNRPQEQFEFLSQFRDWLEGCARGTFNVFVFSLSEEPSLLSQWRSYTPHGKGISIGISAPTLNALIAKEDLKIARCLYSYLEQQELLESLVEKMLLTFAKEFHSIDTTKAHPSQKYHPFLERFRGDVLQVLSIIKHQAFSEEKEWRLISPYYPNYSDPEIKFREGSSMQNLSFSALSMFLSNNRLSNQTENSQIPYREW